MKEQTDQIDHPSHYQGASDEAVEILYELGIDGWMLQLECILIIEAFDLDFHRGNAVKYLWRCGEKGDALTDLKKALWYLDRFLKIHGERGVLWAGWFRSLKYRRHFPQVRSAIAMLEKKISTYEG